MGKSPYSPVCRVTVMQNDSKSLGSRAKRMSKLIMLQGPVTVTSGTGGQTRTVATSDQGPGPSSLTART